MHSRFDKYLLIYILSFLDDYKIRKNEIVKIVPRSDPRYAMLKSNPSIYPFDKNFAVVVLKQTEFVRFSLFVCGNKKYYNVHVNAFDGAHNDWNAYINSGWLTESVLCP